MNPGYPIRAWLALSILLPAGAFAAVFNVGTVAELTNALATASSNGQNDTLNLAADTYMLTTMLTYDSTETNSLTLQCLTNKAVLDANLNSQCLKIYARAANTNAFVTLDGLVIKNGYYDQDGFGSFIGAGALVWSQRGNITVRNSEFSDCFAGGGLYYSANAGGAYLNLQSIGTIAVSNCVFTNNNAKSKGGGAYLTGGSGVTIILRNNLFANNKAQEYGAGAYIYSLDTPVFAENNTFASNQTQVALYVKLYYNTATTWIQNNIFWTNAVSGSYSNDLYVEDDAEGSGSGATNYVFNNDMWSAGWQVGNHVTQDANVARDPMLAATWRLQNGSPCINTGTNQFWMTNALDLDGNPRINSVIVDRGCYEYQLAEGAILGTNLAVIASGEAPSAAKGTDFGTLRADAAVTNFLAITNISLTVPLTISGVSTSGADAAFFRLSSLPATISPGAASNFMLRYAPAAGGLHTAVVAILSNLTNSPYYLNLKGSAWQVSQPAGPAAGGNTLTITNGLLGNGTNITNVIIGGSSAAILDQGANWARVTAPTGAPGVADILVQSATEGAKTFSGAYTFNQPGQIFTNLPVSGTVTGGYPVVIRGTNLCDGTLADVTNVTLAGAAAGVQSVAGSTQVVVLAGPGALGNGHVVVHSIAYGSSIASNAFTYIGPVARVLGTNGAEVGSGESASLPKGTDFGAILVDRAMTNILAITNSGNVALNIAGITTNGANALSFQCLAMPATVSPGNVSNFSLIFRPADGGVATAAVVIVNDSTSSPYRVNLRGTGIWDGVIGITPAAAAFTAVYAGANPAGQFLIITNRGHTRFSFTSQTSYGTGASGWLTALPATGTLATGGTTGITAAVDITGVNAGGYWATNAIVSPQATNSPQIVTIQLTVSQAVQTITFGPIPDSVVTARVSLAATASSGLPVAYTVTNGPGVISGGNILAFSGAGTVAVVAAQAGNSNWHPAPAVTRSCAVTKADQTINFSAIPEQTTTSRVALAATASSGQPVSFSIVGGPGSISAGIMSFTGSGVVQVVAGQDGNALWNPAPNVTNNVVVTAARTPSAAVSSGVCADYDGDGKADPAIYDEATGTWKVKLSSAGYYLVATTLNGLGGPGYASVSADYDGDLKADPAVYQEASGGWTILKSSLDYVVWVFPQTLGGTGYSGMPADYDGDAKAEPCVYQRERGDWKVLLSSAGYYPIELAGFLGGTGYRAVAADYDGDYKADPAVYGESNGVWVFKISSAGYLEIALAQTLGGAGYLPVPADYDGDRLADPAVRSETGNEWIVMFSTGNYTPVHLTISFE